MSTPLATGEFTRHLRVDHVSAVHVAARVARTVAKAAGLPSSLPDQAAVVASELASNLDKHAREGQLYISPVLHGTGVDIIAADTGPGMLDVDRCLADGHTTTGTLGAGLGAIRRMAAEFAVHTVPGEGTLISARVLAPGTTRTPPVAHVNVPAPGEEVSGDLAAVRETGAGFTLLMVDGLGHGPDAAAASAAVLEAFDRDPARPLPALFTELHRGARQTRGAAVAVLRQRGTRGEFLGIGNVSAAVLAGGSARQLLSLPGVVGLRLPPATVRPVELPPGTTVVLHSDGVSGDWLPAATTSAGLVPSLLAGSLVHRHRVTRDDSAVLAVKFPGEPA
ncbi:ATP-binding protein [Amycolatopsis magusensis]|uniref:ATP-binding protein n=1 Tax=Amycolatopsis magusensis TaxID=882444 RepID=UPI003C30DF60